MQEMELAKYIYLHISIRAAAMSKFGLCLFILLQTFDLNFFGSFSVLMQSRQNVGLNNLAKRTFWQKGPLAEGSIYYTKSKGLVLHIYKDVVKVMVKKYSRITRETLCTETLVTIWSVDTMATIFTCWVGWWCVTQFSYCFTPCASCPCPYNTLQMLLYCEIIQLEFSDFLNFIISCFSIIIYLHISSHYICIIKFNYINLIFFWCHYTGGYLNKNCLLNNPLVEIYLIEKSLMIK